jgi:hypothetical protein
MRWVMSARCSDLDEDDEELLEPGQSSLETDPADFADQHRR